MKGSTILIIGLWSLILCSACTSNDNNEADRLNNLSYASHYQSLDRVKLYADSVLSNSSFSKDSKAEALNNLAFYYIGKMQYNMADSILQLVCTNTDNQIEQCISNIQAMRLCQRKSQNKSYYEYRQKALDNLQRIHEENHYTSHQQKRITYADTELRLVTSVYDYYVGKADDAIASLQQLDSLGILKKDTAQYLAYLYNIGSGGMLTHGTKEDIAHLEYDYLMQCFLISSEHSYVYWKANALQALSEHVLEDHCAFFHENPSAAHYVNTEAVPDSILAGNLTEHALQLFREYGDVYQQAASWRTLSNCYARLHDYSGAIYSLQQALKVDTAIVQSPALMASIYELFSLGFSAMDKKPESDYYRNKYLDLYENTRQDRQLEARAEQLDRQVRRLDVLIYVIIAVAIVLVSLLVYLLIRRYRKQRDLGGYMSKTMKRLQKENSDVLSDLEEQEEDLTEQCGMMELQLSRQQTTYEEQRAKMHHINSITPLLDRMLHETSCLVTKQEDEDVRRQRVEYVAELIDCINQENSFLTRWIQLKQGELSLHIESFPLQPLFDIVAECRNTFSRQGITLNVESTDDVIKADRTLTLFMLNTLCDNARKFTPKDGIVNISAKSVDNDMIEIAISDTGNGMTEEQCAHIFDVKAITDEQLLSDTVNSPKSHGFGLLNCKGIIEKYKKLNSLFANCMIGVTSRVGEGTCFFFRLPRGIRKTMIVLLMFLNCCGFANAADVVVETKIDSLNIPPSAECQALADSVYHCNVTARYADAINYAKRCMCLLNKQYIAAKPTSRDTLLLNDTISSISAEVRWMRDSVQTAYSVILSVRNEVAVAALALHEWQLYKYNNNAYSLLFKECSADNSLAEYCETMKSAQSNSNVALCLLLLLLLSFIPIFYFAYYRHVIIDYRTLLRKMKDDISSHRATIDEQLSRLHCLTFEHDRLHVTNNVVANSFSSIKHETMYFPSRMQQLLREDSDDYSELDEIAHYYRVVYEALAGQAQYNSRQLLSPTALHGMVLTLMARLAGCRKAELQISETIDDYDIYHFTVRQNNSANADDREMQLKTLTQVARDLGEQYNLRRCGVVVNNQDVTVTIPSSAS